MVKKYFILKSKKSLILLAFVFNVIFLTTLTAQITIERSDFTLKADVPVTEWRVPIANIVIPTEGANQTWDYSNINYSTPYSTIRIDTSYANLPTANLASSGGVLQLGGIVQPRTWFEALDPNQYATMGMETKAISSSIGATTGDYNDSIYYLGELNVYSEPLISYQWPMNFNDTWSSYIVSNTETNITINSQGLNLAQANQLRHSTFVHTVSGYGNLLLPNPNDTGVLNMEVLLIKTVETEVDSIFFNNQLAPASFLNALNLTQGEVLNKESYSFMSVNLPSAAFSIYYENGAIVFASVSDSIHETKTVSSLSTVAKENGLNIFPNPTKGVVNISLNNDWFGEVFVDIVNVLGEKVRSISIEKNSSKISYSLSSESLPVGIYRAIFSYENELAIKPFIKKK